MPKPELAKLITEKEVAELLRVPVLHVRKLRYSGKLPFYRLGHKSIRFHPERVLEAISRLEIKEVA